MVCAKHASCNRPVRFISRNIDVSCSQLVENEKMLIITRTASVCYHDTPLGS